MRKYEKNISKFVIIFTSILLYLNLTRLHDIAIFDYAFIANFVVSCILIIIFKYKKILKRDFIKNNFLVLLLLLFCGINVIYYRFSLGAIKEFCYLFYFFFVVNTLFDKKKDVVEELSKYVFYICLVINVISIILSILEYFDLKFLPFVIAENTGNYNFYGLYTNPNALGVGTLIALILYNTFCKEKRKHIHIIFICFLLLCIVISGSRASLISVVVYFAMRYFIKKTKKSKEVIAKSFTTILLLLFAFMSTMILIFNDSVNKQRLTGFEGTINSLTTNRYTLWKYSLMSLNEPSDILFGLSSSRIGEERLNQIPKPMFNNYDKFIKKLTQANNNHNGFIQFFVSSGIICTVIVIIWMYHGIINTDYKFIPIITSILMLNMFESEFANSHSLPFFLLCYFLYFSETYPVFGLVNKIFAKFDKLKNKIQSFDYKLTLRKLKTTGFFSIFLASVFGKVVVFLANIILARLLSKSDYGLYAYIFNCFSILTLLGDFGTSSAAMQYISENINSEKEQFKYLKYSVVIGSLLSIVSGLLIVTSPLFYPYTIDESAGIVQLFFLIPFITTIANIFAIILRAHQKNKQFALYNFLTVFVNYLLLVPLTYLMGIKGVVYATYGYHIFAAIYAIYLSRHYLKNFFHKYTIKAKEKIEFIKFSFIMQVNITLSHLLLIIDTFVIGLIISDSNTIATYKVANSIPQALAFIPTCVVIYILPYFIKHNKERKWLNTNIKKIIIYGSVVYGIFAGGLILFSNLIITILYGAQYKEAVLPFCILILGFYFNATFTVPCSSIMQGLRKVNVNLIISVISLVLNLILNFIFINIFGFVGVAITTTLIQIITSAYYLYYLKKKIMIE